jgi:Tripartite tricarboxylate transporter TctB family
MTPQRLSLCIGLFFTAFGVLALWGSARLGFFSFGVPGPGFFPFGAAAVVTIAAVSLCFLKIDIAEKIVWNPALPLIAAVAGYFFLFETLGVMAATALYCLVSLTLICGVPLRTALVTAASCIAILWLGFEYAIGTPLPHGILW